jgi:hypothetical protein
MHERAGVKNSAVVGRSNKANLADDALVTLKRRTGLGVSPAR